ncbi:MAG: sigma-70 family RNA polymerase sigma factor [Bacteroidota bacterium]
MLTRMQSNIKIAKIARMNPSQEVSKLELEAEWNEIQAAQKDTTRFSPLYKRYYEDVFRFVYQRTADETLTAELCSIVFIRALENIKKYENRGVPFSAWLFRIAMNEVASHFRSKKKTRVVSIESSQLPTLYEESSDQNIFTEQTRQELLSALDQLKPKDLNMIEMRFFEKRSFKEIAAILEITEANAKMRTYRAVDRLQKKMKT